MSEWQRHHKLTIGVENRITALPIRVMQRNSRTSLQDSTDSDARGRQKRLMRAVKATMAGSNGGRRGGGEGGRGCKAPLHCTQATALAVVPPSGNVPMCS